MPDIFLSYSSEDRNTARRFAEGFERAGFDVWWDQTLRSGEAFDQVIEAALKEASAVVVLWSKRSVESRWVRAEATVGDRNRRLVPVMIESCQRPVMFELTHTADLAHWKGASDDSAWLSLVADVRRHVEPVGSAFASSPARHVAITAPVTNARWRTALVATFALLLAGSGAWLIVGSHGHQAAAVASTLAVLPFTDMSPEHDQEYFSDGLSEEILNQLAKIKRLTVAARTSSFAFKGQNEDMRVIGQKLGVANLLEGSIRKDGRSLRITAQLIESRGGTHLWSKTYDREMSSVFAVQEEIAKDVAQALSVKLDAGELRREEGGTTNVEAYEAYLAGVALANRSGDRRVRAAEEFRRAVLLDPTFFNAWLRLGSVQLGYARATGTEVPAEVALAFERARNLRPNSPDVYFLSGTLAEMNLAWGEAAQQYRVARSIVEKNGLSGSEVDQYDANLLLIVGRVKEARSFMQRAKLSGDLEDFDWKLSADAKLYGGDSAAAMTEIEQGFRLSGVPGYQHGMIMTALSTRDRVHIDKWIDAAFDPDEPQHVSADMKPLLDRPAEALARLRQLAAETSDPGQHAWISHWVAYFHDPEAALQILQGISSGRRISRIYVVWTIWDPLMNDVRKLPGFKKLVRDAKLVEYWREFGWGDFCQPVGAEDFDCR